MYECVICLSLNHASRLHCQNCGTVPAFYSIFGIAGHFTYSENAPHFTPTIAAKGCDRIERHRSSRLNLRTVEHDYYASGE